MAHDVFISYSSKDKPIADAACATLEANALRCWIAPRDILPGADWGESIIDAINESRVMILVFSSNANASPQIKREVERAVSKGIPILPFRIENVPLSKSLEYFISTPHWLDALTQPMEQHLQYLTQTVNLLLARASGQTGPGIQKQSPVPAPANRTVLIVAIVLGFLLLSAFGYLGVKYAIGPPQEKDTLVEEKLQPEEKSRPAAESPSEQKPESTPALLIDPGIVGSWQTNALIDGKNWNMNLTITPQRTFRLKSTTSDSGTYNAFGGAWGVQSKSGDMDGGSYTKMNQNAISMTGRLGTAIWTRTGPSNSRDRHLLTIDPFVIGVWKTNVAVKGAELQLLFEMRPNGSYTVTTIAEDNGTFEATNGTLKQTSVKGQILEGTYQILSKDSVSMTGPLGTAVWTRK